MADPTPLDLPTHPDPYPSYRRLIEREMHHDARIGIWVAARRNDVASVLASRDCGVRPIDQPVPLALAGTAAGALFGQLVRMSDGPRHARRRRDVVATLSAFDAARVATVAEAHARTLLATGSLSALQFGVAPLVVATLLGVRDETLATVTRHTASLVQAFAPGASTDDVRTGSTAADALRATVGSANAVGLMIQSYDATAGLIANTVSALLAGCAGDVATVVADVARRDPSVHNTRRFVHRDTVVAGTQLRAGDTILVLLAPHALGFGEGAHRCPGERIALTVATATVATLIESGRMPDAPPSRYKPAQNTRIPLL